MAKAPDSIEKGITWILKNWDIIPDTQKTVLSSSYGDSHNTIPGVPLEDHIVILLLDRQKPSVIADYSFDQERISISHSGKIIWGFDSGCSCPSPWHDSFPKCYSCTQTWKEFQITNLKDFDENALPEVLTRIEEIKKATI